MTAPAAIAAAYGCAAQDVILATLIANGRTQAEIGRVMFLTAGGVGDRIRSAMRRTGAGSPEQFAALVLGRPVPGADPPWKGSGGAR